MDTRLLVKGPIARRLPVLVLSTILLLVSSLASADFPLTKAAYHNEIDAVKTLLADGADVNAKNEQNVTALFMASYKGNIDIVHLLLASGADVSVKTTSSDTALIVASQNGHNEVLKALLKKKPDVNARNNKGATGLILASYAGHTDVVRTLLASGADVNMETYNDKSTALSSAQKGNHPAIVALLKQSGANDMDVPEPAHESDPDVTALVSFKKSGIQKIAVSLPNNLKEKWPAVFPSGTGKLSVVLVTDYDPAHGVRLDTRIETKSGKIEIAPQGPPGRFSIFGKYYLTQDVVAPAGKFSDGEYHCLVLLNGKKIAKIKWAIGNNGKQ